MKYLDMANMNFTMGVSGRDMDEINKCETNLDNFLETIDGDSEEGKQISMEFDRIDEKKHKNIQKLKDYIKDQGELEKIDSNAAGQFEIYVDCLHDKKTVCWNVAIEFGLFHG